MQILRIVFYFMIVFILFTGCSGKENQMFVKNAPQSETPSRVSVDQTYKIKPHDRLSIIFFEYPELSTKSKDLSESDVGIEVHTNGTITMPIIGEVVVAGKSKDQVVDMLYRRYSSYLEKPALRVEILNQKIYVLGEVKNPGSIELLKHRTITPLKAIAERGGLTDFAQRDVIKVVRGNRESYQVFHIDLTDMHSVHNNNVGLLPDDIVYVAHNRVKDFNLPLSGANPSLSWINTLFSTLTVYQVWK